MAGSEGKEAKYKRLLQELGVYTEACDAIIADLCTLERERSRARKAWKAAAPEGKAPLFTDPLYQVIEKQSARILKYQVQLCLTPDQIQKLRRQSLQAAEAAPEPSSGSTAFSHVLDKLKENANGSEA